VIDSFKKDIFYKNKVSWKRKKNLLKDQEFIKLNQILKKKFGIIQNIYIKKGLNINSYNYKVKINNKFYLLKKWNNKSLKEIKKINTFNNFLNKKLKFFPRNY